MKTGEQPTAPIGPHYINIGVKVVSPNSSVDVAAGGARRPETVKPHYLLPILEGFFGPLRIPLPRTSAALDVHSVKQWRTKSSVGSAAVQRKGCPKHWESGFGSYCRILPADCRRAFHPAVQMKGCPKYLGCFRGASLDSSESDVIWRWL